jgi:hypothetical protein
MAVTKGLGTTGNGAGTVTPLDHKLAQAGLIAKTGAGTNLVRPGLFYDGVSTIVSGKANMSYDVAPFTAALTRGATAGAVLLSNDGTVNVVTTAAPGSNSRIDSVYVWQREFSLDGTDSNPVIGVVQGTAAASPVAPSLAAFPGAIELARITVPAGVTATNSGTTITQTAPFTTVDGGVLVRRTTAERDAIASPMTGLLVRVLADGITYQYTGSTWIDAAGTVFSHRQLDTTNDSGRFLIQQGIGRIAGANAASVSEAVTFPVAFAAVPMVVCQHIGGRTTGAFNTTGLIEIAVPVMGQPVVPSTTGFTAKIHRTDGANLSTGFDMYYSWLAIGVAA